MELLKNSELIQNICQVQIKSVDQTVLIPNFTTVYSTPSKIMLTNSSDLQDSGVLHNKRLSLVYPGLSKEDFANFNDLVRGHYKVIVRLANTAVYEIASEHFPMGCRASYNSASGHALIFENKSPVTFKYLGNQQGYGIATDGFTYDFNFYLQ